MIGSPCATAPQSPSHRFGWLPGAGRRLYEAVRRAADGLYVDMLADPRRVAAERQRWLDDLHAKEPWDFGKACERDRFDRVIRQVTGAVNGRPWGRVFEVGCADGIFTLQLAARSESVVAWDCSAVACGRGSAWPHAATWQWSRRTS